MTQLVPDRAVNFVAHWEGFLAKASNALDGVWTIGYGHTEGVEPGDTITHEKALELLRRDLRNAALEVDRQVRNPERLSDEQRAALISFIYNVGPGAFEGSTLKRLLNKRGPFRLRKKKIRAAWEAWCKAPNGPNGGLVVMPGLERRRRAEVRLFFR